jgi:hypothetical protein
MGSGRDFEKTRRQDRMRLQGTESISGPLTAKARRKAIARLVREFEQQPTQGSPGDSARELTRDRGNRPATQPRPCGAHTS